MDCLHCGDCCLRMSPKSAPAPCPDIIQDGTFYFCGDYKRRPEACVNHSFQFRYCPIGFEKLGLKNPQDVAQRIDAGFELIMQYSRLYPRKQEAEPWPCGTITKGRHGGMKGMPKLEISYNAGVDVLYISIGEPRPGIAAECNDGDFIRVDPDTNEVVGITLLDFCERFIRVAQED